MKSVVQDKQLIRKKQILEMIRLNNGEGVSRYDLKQKTSYSMDTITGVVSELIQDGYLYEEQSVPSGRGRKPILLKLSRSRGYFIGVEFNADQIQAVAVDFSGDVIGRFCDEVPAEATADVILRLIGTAIKNSLRTSHGEFGEPFGIGIGVPGSVDYKKGLAVRYEYFTDWENIPLVRIISEKFQLPCFIENNINSFAFAYRWFYRSRIPSDSVLLSVRTGARLIPIVNDRIIISTAGKSGEIGHIRVLNSSRYCACGYSGCLNAEISNVAIVSKIKERQSCGKFKGIVFPKSNKNMEIIKIFMSAVRENREEALLLLDDLAYYYAYAISIIFRLYAPRHIILLGTLAKLDEKLIDRVRYFLDLFLTGEDQKNFQISTSGFGDDLGAIGAAALVMRRQFDYREGRILL